MHKDLIDLFSLSGKVALVTGGTSPLGFEAASVLAAAGCNIAITSRDLQKAIDSAKKLKNRYEIEAVGIQLNHTQPDQVTDCSRKLMEWGGRLDILINNAGGGSGTTIAKLFERAPEDIHQSIQTNLTGMIYCCREFGKLMADQGKGKIVNIASIAGLIGRDRRMYDRAGMLGQPVDYAAAKAGVIGLTQDLAGYFSPMGIYVNAISPGGFTGKNRQHSAQFIDDYSDRTPLGRMGRDGIDLKGSILFLSSQASDYITGHNLVVDGGFSIWH